MSAFCPTKTIRPPAKASALDNEAVCDREPILVDQPADAFQNRGLRFEGRWVGELERLRNDADIELKETGRWATTFHPDPVLGAG